MILGDSGLQSSAGLPRQGATRREWRVLFKSCKACRVLLTQLAYFLVGHAVLEDQLNSRRARREAHLSFVACKDAGKGREQGAVAFVKSQNRTTILSIFTP